MKVQVHVPKDKSGRPAYKDPVVIVVDGELVAIVKWVNGPPYYEVHFVDENGHLDEAKPR